MNSPGMPERVLRAVFWILPFVLPLILYWNLDGSGSVPEATSGFGIGWLALPAEIPERPAPATDWKSLQRGDPPLVVPPVVRAQIREKALPPVSRPGVSEGDSFRIRVHGHLGEGLDKVYLLFDTAKGRWFRLMAGEADREAGVVLRLSGVTGGVKLVDLDGGREYVVDEEEDLLARVVQ